MDYRYTLPPRQYQRDAFTAAYGKAAFGYIMDQGTGKTKAVYDEAFNLHLLGDIDCLIVIAPNDVHRAWVNEELPKHALPDIHVTAVVWDGKQTKKKQQELGTLFNPGFKLLAVNVEAFQRGKPLQNRAFQFVKRLLSATRAMLVVDESQDIKTPKSQRTKTVLALARYAHKRRILTGTVITQSPFDFYAQFKFLDPDIIGFTTYTAFKNQYGVFVRKRSPHKKMVNGRLEDVWFDDLVEYRNLDDLLAKVGPHCFRVEKRDVLKDLPEKIYMPVRRVELSAEQRRVYKALLDDGLVQVRKAAQEQNVQPRRAQSLEDELWAWCLEDVPTVVADTALKVAGKLRQVCGGVVRDSDGTWHRIEGTPPKLKALLTDIVHNQQPAIIWCVYQEECELVAAALRDQYGDQSTVVFSGRYDDQQRDDAKRRFREDTACQFFVTSYAAARGHTLTKATAAYYYTTHDSVEKRLQSEDRNHRVGSVGQLHDGKRCVIYTDYVIADTVDEKRYEQTMQNARDALGHMTKLKSVLHCTGT